MKPLNINIVKGFILFLVISLEGLSIIYGYQQLVTFVFIPFLLVVSFSLNDFKLTSLKNKYARYFLAIIILGIFLVSISINLETAFQNILSLFGVYLTILLTIELLQYKNFLFLEIFLLAFVLAFFILAGYLLLIVGKNNIELNASYIDRSQFDLNANTYSYFSFFANMALFYLIQLTRKRIYIITSFACLILGVYISFVTASRSGIMFTILTGSMYWLLIFDRIRSNRFFRFLVVFIFICYGAFYIYGVYNNSFLKLRVDTYSETGDPRSKLAANAINVFMDHPFTGVGPGQFYLFAFNRSSFSHNSYTEMAANMGIIGIIILFLLLFTPLFREIGTYFKTGFHRSLVKLNILFFFSFILINNIYVFYLTTYGMIFFFIIIVIQQRGGALKRI